MNEKVWREIFTKYILDYSAIERLSHDGILECSIEFELKDELLSDIIETFKSEVEE